MKQNFLRKYFYWLGFITLANFIFGFFDLFFKNTLMDILGAVVTIPEVIMLVVSIAIIIKIKKHKLSKKYLTIPLVFLLGYIALIISWSVAESQGMDTENIFAAGTLFFYIISFVYYGSLSFASFYTLFSDSILKKLDTDSNVAQKEGKKNVTGVAGWLGFFVFTLAMAIPLNLMIGVSDVFSIIDNPENTTSVVWALVPIDILLFAGIIFFAIYSIILLVKRKPNAIVVAKMYLIILFVNNAFYVLFSTVSGDTTDSSSILSDSMIIRSLFYTLIWFLYLSFSKRVKNTYPKDQRKTFPFDIIAFVIILAIPATIYIFALIGITLPEEQQADNSINNYMVEWQELNSMDDGFKIKFPAYPYYEEDVYYYPDLATFLHYRQYAASLEDGTEYYVIITDYPPDQSFDDDRYNLEAAINSRLVGDWLNLISSQETMFDDYMAMDYLFQEIEDGYFLQGKFIMKGDILYDVMVAYDDGEYNDHDYNKFIDSFEFLEN